MKYFANVLDHILAKKFKFLAVFFIVYTLSYGVLTWLDFLPEPVDVHSPSATTTSPLLTPPAEASTTAETTLNNEQSAAVGASGADVSLLANDTLPQTMTIDALGRTLTVLNPASRTNASLDAALLQGVIRHPDSATLNQDGNIFILGHSSYLPKVFNKNFQALNGIQNLKWGDTIRLTSSHFEYVYRVEKVYKAKASALTIPVSGTGKRLTLATCNSFGSTDDRYIVEASLIKTTALQ